jgi:hypothetical protein
MEAIKKRIPTTDETFDSLLSSEESIIMKIKDDARFTRLPPNKVLGQILDPITVPLVLARASGIAIGFAVVVDVAVSNFVGRN